MPVVRRATARDAAAIQALYSELVGDDANVRVDERVLQARENDPSQILLVAENGGQVLATAFLVICRDVMYGDQPFALVENIVVASSARRHGIGTTLLAEIQSLCRAEHCTKIMLLSNAKRAEAHDFFARNGYRGDVKRGFVNYLNR